MKIRDFYALVDLEQEPNESMLPNLEKLIDRFPVFQAGQFVYIKCLYLLDSPTFVEKLNKLAPFIHDRKALFYYIFREIYEKYQTKKKSKKIADRTDMLINAFFETTTLKLEDQLSDPMSHSVHNPTMASFDYLSYIGISDGADSIPDDIAGLNTFQQKNDSLKMKGQDMIDRFISQSEQVDTPLLTLDTSGLLAEAEELPDESDDSEDDFFFTQTLIDIYIKQRKYEKAYEIIKRLSLNYPEKNIYFADQLRYLEKHIKTIE